MKIYVDSKKCTGHAMCYWTSQKLFDLDDDGKAFVALGQEDVSRDLEDAAQEAVGGCPEGAIWIEQ